MTTIAHIGPLPRAEIMAIDAYVPGRSQAGSASKIHKLSSNESPLGASPNAVEAFRTSASKLERYPDGSASGLREAIGRHFGIEPARIICGNGSDELLALLAHAFARAGDEGLCSEYGFLEYPICIRAAGAVPIIAKEIDKTVSVDEIVNKVTERTKIVYLANPNNPTGTYIPLSELRRLHAELPVRCLLVIDAAYAEYVMKEDYAAGIELATTCENVVMTRTFSKIYGLASLRVGWAYGPRQVIDAVNRVRGPFNVNGPALAAGVASLSDSAHIEKAVDHNQRWLPWLTQEISSLGIEVTPSVANFLLLRFRGIRGQTAANADSFLTARGFILRALTAYGLPDSLRLTVGGEDANKGVVVALKEFLRVDHA